jgi:hypothetical protein
MHVGKVDHGIKFTFAVGTDDFSLEFMPGETIHETEPKSWASAATVWATPTQMYGTKLCYFTVSGRFLKKEEPYETESDEESDF